MAARDRHGRHDPDDWFAGLDDAAPARRRSAAAPPSPVPARQRRAPEERPPLDATAQARTSDGLTFTLGSLLAAAAVAVAVIVVAVLALTGVFSQRAEHPVTAATTPKTLPTNQSPTTSATTTTTPAPSTRKAFPIPTSPLQPGDTGAQVKLLQRALRRLGYLTSAADGTYGTATQTALTALQRVSLLPADGILGPRTLHALDQALKKAVRASP